MYNHYNVKLFLKCHYCMPVGTLAKHWYASQFFKPATFKHPEAFSNPLTHIESNAAFNF